MSTTTPTTPEALPPTDGSAWTHKKAVRRMAAWLRNTNKFSCSVVAAELATQNSETPDVIGFYGAGASVLIECKVSRADFLSDKTKHFRRIEEMGMGDLRYYATPQGLLKPDELPEGWGLFEMGERCVHEIRPATSKKADKRCEVKFLMSVIRRVEISSAVFVQHDEQNAEVSSAS